MKPNDRRGGTLRGNRHGWRTNGHGNQIGSETGESTATGTMGGAKRPGNAEETNHQQEGMGPRSNQGQTGQAFGKGR